MAAKIKKGDRVVVMAGRDKGKTGEVRQVMPVEGRAIVAGVNMVRRHTKPSAQTEGGILSKESPIHLSNLAIADPSPASPRASASRSSTTAARSASPSVPET